VFPTVIAAALCAPASPPAAPAAAPPDRSRYYFILFGGQSVPFSPWTAHTWATYVKVTPTPGGPVVVEPHTISWLPADQAVRIRNIRPVVGRNFTLPETLEIMRGHKAQVSYWGPFEIDADRYGMAIGQVGALESGGVRYRVLDSFTLNHRVCHCVHAVTYADPVVGRYIQPVLRVGEPGTSNLATKYLRCGACRWCPQSPDWLIPTLGIDRYGAIKREPGEWIPRRWLW
jgi:hypothetical protein